MIGKINSIIFLRLLIIFFFAFQSISVYAAKSEQNEGRQCLENIAKHRLLNGWYLWEPYQFNKITAGGYSLTGMDIELVKTLADKIGIKTEYEVRR